jgi:hypothetical protein
MDRDGLRKGVERLKEKNERRLGRKEGRARSGRYLQVGLYQAGRVGQVTGDAHSGPDR